MISTLLSVVNSKTVDVAVRQGTLRGTVEENDYGDRYIAFRGIPYAKPPVGKLRFKDPLPTDSWSGVRDASKCGNACFQINLLTHEILGSEDCLYLNVYTDDVKPRVKRAVMVWIHGGRYSAGSGDQEYYGPEHIVQKDVVLVTLNYRLGVFGFLNLQHEVAAGNQGLKDIIMALRWVQENISNFGGDSGNVTIFGESAGGALVNYVAISPLSNGLYHKVITQSGVALAAWALAEWQKGFILAEKLGKQTTDPKIAGEFLKTIDAREILKASRTVLTSIEYRQFYLEFGPTPDLESSNPFFPEHPAVMIRRGIEVPYLFGNNKDEGIYFACGISDNGYRLMNSKFSAIVNPKLLPALKEQSITLEDLRFIYFGDKPASNETRMNYANLINDLYFVHSAYEAADIQMRMGHRSTYMYKFSYDSGNSFIKIATNIDLPGVPHSEELLYLFYPHAIRNHGLQAFARNSDEYRMSKCITQMWTDFAKTGNPTPAITELTPITWTPLEKRDVYNYLNIDKQLQMEIVRKGERNIDWKKMKHKL